ncbi:MAG: hypothetical protein ACREMY_16880 [bacterium]
MEHQATPIVYPTVRLAGNTYEVRFTCGSIIRLKNEYGIELDQLQGKQLRGAEAIEQTCKLLAAGISHQAKLTVQEIADSIDLAEMHAYANAITEALKKAAPQTEGPKLQPIQ